MLREAPRSNRKQYLGYRVCGNGSAVSRRNLFGRPCSFCIRYCSGRGSSCQSSALPCGSARRAFGRPSRVTSSEPRAKSHVCPRLNNCGRSARPAMIAKRDKHGKDLRQNHPAQGVSDGCPSCHFSSIRMLLSLLVVGNR